MLFFGDTAQSFLPGTIHLLSLLIFCLGFALITKSKFRRWLIVAGFGLLCWAWIFSTPMIASLVLHHLEGGPVMANPAGMITHPDSNSRPVYLVLGSATPGNFKKKIPPGLTLAGWRRLEATAKAWHKTGGLVVVAGGFGEEPNPEQTSIAARMRKVAVSFGIANVSIRDAAHQSTNTYEDVRAGLAVAKKLIRHGSNRQIVLVTSAAHMPRALAIAEKTGATVTPMRCDWRQLRAPSWRAWLPSHGGPALWEIAIHEIIGLWVYRWRGWS